MRKKVVVFSQIDAEILSKLEQDYQVVQVSPKLGDVNQQLLEHVQDADGMIGAGRLLNQSNNSQLFSKSPRKNHLLNIQRWKWLRQTIFLKRV